jgi:hypothetical protein
MSVAIGQLKIIGGLSCESRQSIVDSAKSIRSFDAKLAARPAPPPAHDVY